MYSTALIPCSLAVIGPPIQAAVQILLPMLLVAGSALLVGIPRIVLAAGHWAWVQLVPLSLRDRSIPGVKSHMYQGTVLSQFVDDYAFPLPSGCSDPAGAVAEFFRRRGGKLQAQGDRRLQFTRGSRLCTYFLSHILPCRERHFLQQVEVDFRNGWQGQMQVRVRYTVRAFYMLRVGPAGLQSEVRAMRDALTATAAA